MRGPLWVLRAQVLLPHGAVCGSASGWSGQGSAVESRKTTFADSFAREHVSTRGRANTAVKPLFGHRKARMPCHQLLRNLLGADLAGGGRPWRS